MISMLFLKCQGVRRDHLMVVNQLGPAIIVHILREFEPRLGEDIEAIEVGIEATACSMSRLVVDIAPNRVYPFVNCVEAYLPRQTTDTHLNNPNELPPARTHIHIAAGAPPTGGAPPTQAALLGDRSVSRARH